MEKNFEQKIEVGTLVRWNEFPDRLYIVREKGINHCGKDNYCKIETIDKKWLAILPITELVWDDVDYIEIETESESESKSVYRERYEQALERAIEFMSNRGIKPDEDAFKCAKELSETIFPELRESEDDRIRKDIVSFLGILLEQGGVMSEGWNSKECEKYISWLEKHNPENTVSKIVSDEETDMQKAHREWRNEGIEMVINHPEEYGLQKKCEWSGEDYEMLESFLHKLEVCDLLSNKENVWAIRKLKSIRPQPHWKPSEEQMEELEYVTRGNSYPHLTSLYQDLKNL